MQGNRRVFGCGQGVRRKTAGRFKKSGGSGCAGPAVVGQILRDREQSAHLRRPGRGAKVDAGRYRV